MKLIIPMNTFRLCTVTTLSLGVVLAFSNPAASMFEERVPDLTQGEPVPSGHKHDWSLGATGARGWMFTHKLTTIDARQIAITKVDAGSPADGTLEVGDVILGVAEKRFAYDPRTEFGKALTTAETEAAGGKLSLIRWRKGKEETVVITLPVLGTYSATAPYDCPKSKLIFEQGCELLAKRIAEPNYQANPITRSLNALALLASGDPKYLPIVKREAKWASGYSANTMQTWYYGYVITLLAEYQMATGDQSFMPDMRRLALEAAKGQSIVGSWGHGFANPDGRLGGYGMMNAPGLPLTLSLTMARAAGVKDSEVDLAIERSARLIRFYAGKGAVPYGDHAPWTETHEDNGKCGMAALMFSLLNEPDKAEFFSRMSVASHGAERDGGHTGNFFNVLWSLPAVAQAGPHATGAWMQEFGGWYYDLARRWDGTFVHLGPPEEKNDSYADWDCTGAYLLAYSLPLKKIYLTGKRPSIIPQIDSAEANRLIEDGRGWNNKDRFSAYDKLDQQELLQRLTNWSPIVRERAAIAISRKPEKPIPDLIKLLQSSRIESRYGACQALAMLKNASAPAVAELEQCLEDDDLWLRIEAAEALVAIGEPAVQTIPRLLELLAEVDLEKDPRGMQQRYFCFALFNSRGGILGRSFDKVDRDLLYQAVRAGLQNEDGRARGTIGSVYKRLSKEEIQPLLPAIYQAVVEPAPSGIMFADQIRVEGISIMASHHIEEGMQAGVDYIRTQNKWASQIRTPELLEFLLQYGSNMKPLIPELEKIAAEFAAGEENFPKNLSLQKAAAVREAIRKIEASELRPELSRIKAE